MTAPLARRLAVAAGLLAGAPPAAAQGPDLAFMPSGGREEAAGLLAAHPDGLPAGLDRAGWRDWLAREEPALPADAAARLAAYLALALPAGAPLPAPGALPPDGRDLAVAQCQSCHSLFTGYLTQRRDEAGWLGVFKSPFHSGLPLTEAERATFAAYSALAMPVPVESVPPELRF